MMVGIKYATVLVASLTYLAYSVLAENKVTDCAAEGSTSSSCSVQASDARKVIWTNALLSTAVISVFGNVGIVLYLFVDERLTSGWALRTMVAFAVGGLLGDVFLHILPHASSGDPHDTVGGLWILAGVFTFFFLEKLVRMWAGPDHSHSHSQPTEQKKSTEVRTIRPGAWLNLIADVSHNFVDGMAIAAAFQTSNVLGASTTLGVLFHEIPHEMGDFAVLLAQGFTKKAAFLAQFVSAVGAFAGCFFGLYIHNKDTEPRAVLGFTAGGFVYVALVDVLPEILDSETGFLQLLREMVAIGVGIGIMVLIARMEEHNHVAGASSHSHSHLSQGTHGHIHSN